MNIFRSTNHKPKRTRARIQINFLTWAAAAAIVMVLAAWFFRQTVVGKPAPTEHVSGAVAQALALDDQKEKSAYMTNFIFTRIKFDRTDFGGVWGASFSCGIKNNGDRAVTGIKITLSMMDTNGNICHQEPFIPFYDKTNAPMLPGQSWGTDENNPCLIPALPDSWQGGFDYAQVTDVQFLNSK